MNFLIRPTDPCCCGSFKSYRTCCSKLTRLPKNPSLDLRYRYWTKYTNEVIANLLSFLDSVNRLEHARNFATSEIDGENLDYIEDLVGLELIDLLALFHIPAYELNDDDQDQENVKDGEDVLTNDSPVLQVPLGVLTAIAEQRFDRSPQKEAFRELTVRPFSWFQIINIEPDGLLTLRDLLLDQEFAVYGQSVCEAFELGSILCGKALHFEGISLIAGLFPMVLSATCMPDLERAKKSLLECISEEFDGELTAESLNEYGREVVKLFTEEALVQSTKTELDNSDGDAVEPRRLIYSWTGSSVSQIAGRIFQILDSILDDSQPRILAKDPTGQPQEIAIRCIDKTPEDPMLETDSVATIIVKPGTVSVECNSASLAEKLSEKLSLLDDLLTLDDTCARDVL
jgi:hypothetical protein